MRQGKTEGGNGIEREREYGRGVNERVRWYDI